MKKPFLLSILAAITITTQAQDSLLIKANKDSALVKINNKIVGKTPLYVKLKTKSYIFSLEKEISDIEIYYVEKKIFVNTKKTEELTFELKRKTNPNYKKYLKENENIFYDKINNKTYKTVQLGGDIWFTEPLGKNANPNNKGIQLINEDTIKRKSLFLKQDIKAYKYFVNNIDDTLYLYNWNACVNNEKISNTETEIQGVCPNGWHIPNKKDIDVLFKDTTNNDNYKKYFNINNNYKYISKLSGEIINVPDLYIWTSINEDNNNAKALNKRIVDEELKLYSFDISYGFPVRCVRNTKKNK